MFKEQLQPNYTLQNKRTPVVYHITAKNYNNKKKLFEEKTLPWDFVRRLEKTALYEIVLFLNSQSNLLPSCHH